MTIETALYLYENGICVTFDGDRHIPICYKEM